MLNPLRHLSPTRGFWSSLHCSTRSVRRECVSAFGIFCVRSLRGSNWTRFPFAGLFHTEAVRRVRWTIPIVAFKMFGSSFVMFGVYRGLPETWYWRAVSVTSAPLFLRHCTIQCLQALPLKTSMMLRPHLLVQGLMVDSRRRSSAPAASLLTTWRMFRGLESDAWSGIIVNGLAGPRSKEMQRSVQSAGSTSSYRDVLRIKHTVLCTSRAQSCTDGDTQACAFFCTLVCTI